MTVRGEMMIFVESHLNNIKIFQDSLVVIVRMMMSLLARCWVTSVSTDVSDKFLPRQRRFDGSLYLVCWPGSVVGIATGYGLDGMGIESW